ncbi:ABC transporter substrate-binding protein [Clostridium sp. FS41]|uniref:ABC transporter substrate-binding protein n=1 Tax=Clostridium sp. FS41 TaxID=1609975 RepID=UPI0005D2F29E|nr:ABC transporter substrate-binding protein [Clostridium sp. FS41]KJJ74432.1 putative ABC transporter substrate-binding protein YesO [Clostridium sp. FS41]
MKKNVRKLGALLLAGAMAVSTAGCMPTAKQQDATAAQNTQESSTAQENAGGSEAAQGAGEAAAELAVDTQTPITLRMNWWGGDSRHQATLAAIEKFQEKYPNITVTAEYEAFNGHEEKIALGIKSGNAADVMQLDWSWVPTYSPNGDNFYDLNKVSNILNLDNYTEGDKAVFTINGKLDAIPISNTGRVFCWNKTTFDKIGVEIPGTLDELLAAGKAFEAYDESYYPLVTKELDRAFLMVYYLQCKYGKDWVKDGALQYSQEEVAEGFDFLKNLEDNHVIPTLQKVAGDGADLIDTNANWIDGHYAGIFLYDTSVVKHAEAVKDGEFVIGDYVEMGDYHGGFIKVNQAFGISATTEYPAEAAALIQFLVAEEDGVKTLGDTRGVPANKEGLAMLDLSGSQVAEANAKAVAWSSFQMDPTFERNSFTGADGTFFNALQLSSYGESDSMSCAKIVLDGVAQELAR